MCSDMHGCRDTECTHGISGHKVDTSDPLVTQSPLPCIITHATLTAMLCGVPGSQTWVPCTHTPTFPQTTCFWIREEFRTGCYLSVIPCQTYWCWSIDSPGAHGSGINTHARTHIYLYTQTHTVSSLPLCGKYSVGTQAVKYYVSWTQQPLPVPRKAMTCWGSRC